MTRSGWAWRSAAAVLTAGVVSVGVPAAGVVPTAFASQPTAHTMAQGSSYRCPQPAQFPAMMATTQRYANLLRQLHGAQLETTFMAGMIGSPPDGGRHGRNRAGQGQACSGEGPRSADH